MRRPTIRFLRLRSLSVEPLRWPPHLYEGVGSGQIWHVRKLESRSSSVRDGFDVLDRLQPGLFDGEGNGSAGDSDEHNEQRKRDAGKDLVVRIGAVHDGYYMTAVCIKVKVKAKVRHPRELACIIGHRRTQPNRDDLRFLR